jgi:hypothetical protein
MRYFPAYHYYSVLELPYRLFFQMYESISVITAEEDLRMSKIIDNWTYLEYGTSKDEFFKLKQDLVKTINTVIKTKKVEVEPTQEDFIKLCNIFGVMPPGSVS